MTDPRFDDLTVETLRVLTAAILREQLASRHAGLIIGAAACGGPGWRRAAQSQALHYRLRAQLKRQRDQILSQHPYLLAWIKPSNG